jgi:putative flippase GtrA
MYPPSLVKIHVIAATLKKDSVNQFIKFAVTGGLNTFVDFAVLNLLIFVFGLALGDPRYIFFKAISYICASINSFVINKWWVFKNKTGADTKEVGSFTLVSVVGLVLNTLISLTVFHGASILLPTLDAKILANIGAITGTLLVLIFNFVAYKFFVFKK